MRLTGSIAPIAVLLALLAGHLHGQQIPADPYEALARGALPEAIDAFRQAVAAQPDNPALRKDFAYALLKIGESEAARDQFGEAVRLTPQDTHAALEYAFLCHETGRQAEAWALFRDLREAPNPEHRETARRTFARLDEELRARIESLEAALARNPSDDGSHAELARTAAIRNDFSKAAAHFEQAFRLKPQYPELLLSLAEAAHKAGDPEKAIAATLLAFRGASAFVAEQARALLPERYPYLYEFENALALQPAASGLRREMAFFLVSLGRGGDAILHFREVLNTNPLDLLASAQLGFLLTDAGNKAEAESYLRAALATSDTSLRERVRAALGEASPSVTAPSADPFREAAEAREMGRKSYGSGFIPDAVRYYRRAHDLDPTDFDTMLRLGQSLNMARRDQEAIQWFFLAARGPDAAVAAEATSALRSLTAPAPSIAAMAAAAPPREGLVSSFWAMPMHSTRWGSTFAYSQAKSELDFSGWPLVPYLSLRFVGDTTGAVGGANPQFLSENAIVVGGGLRTRPRNGFLFWAEAGSAMAYLGSQRESTASAVPDYRGGLSHFKLLGPSLVSARKGWFAETMNDLVYIHRFDRDTLAISRNRIGHHFGALPSLGGLQSQLFLNLNANADFKRQAWANFIEAGPGVRFRWSAMPPSVSFTFSTLRGHHPIPRVDGRPNTYTDFQAGLWYAFSR